MDDQASHWLVDAPIKSLVRRTHRGAMAADDKTANGCRLLMKKSDAFFRRLANKVNASLGPLYASGMVFLSKDALSAEAERGRLGPH